MILKKLLTKKRLLCNNNDWERASNRPHCHGDVWRRTLSSFLFFVIVCWTSFLSITQCYCVPASISGLSATSISDRRIDVDWSDASEYDYYKVYTSTNQNQLVLISTPPVSFYTLTISTSVVKPIMYYFQVAVSSKGVDGPLSAIVSATVTINIEYYDVDGDGVQEKAENLDNNITNGFETYNDSNMNSSVLYIADMTDDGKMDILIDTNADNKPDKFWAPADGVVTDIVPRNVDLDEFFEYTLDVNGDGIYEKFFDEQDFSVISFCRITGSVSPAVATISLKYDGSVIESTDVNNGTYSLMISTLNINDYYSLVAYTSGRAIRENKIFLKHGEIFTVNFSLPAAAVKSFGIHTFPNPIKQKSNVTIVFDNKEEDVSLTLYNAQQERIKDFFTNENPPVKSFVWNLKDDKDDTILPGLYYIVLKSKKNKEIFKMYITK
ncbi:MAG: hypothetical protein WC976_07125 [Caldisericia bacterium]